MGEEHRCWKKGCSEDAHEVVLPSYGAMMCGYLQTCSKHEAEIRKVISGVVDMLDASKREFVKSLHVKARERLETLPGYA